MSHRNEDLSKTNDVVFLVEHRWLGGNSTKGPYKTKEEAQSTIKNGGMFLPTIIKIDKEDVTATFQGKQIYK